MSNRVGFGGRNIDLFVKFVDQFGDPINSDTTPKVTITDYNNVVRQTASNRGVSLFQDPGIYKLTYSIPENFPDGYAVDTWVAQIGNDTITTSFSFLVTSSASFENMTDPEYTPGDDITFKFTKEECDGIDVLLKILRRRLKNNGTRKVPDGMGGFVDQPCNIFSDDEMTCFLISSLSDFNSTPHFTSYTFADPATFGIFADIILQGANLLALAAQALIEKGREFVITDNGISFQPPAVSEILNSQYTTQLTVYREKLKFIKANLKPGPRGLGTFRTTAVAPAFIRLRHLRERQII
ncbi:MAG: hypothetical protein HQK96_18955 [Nitrospirae bacterium]|nr:hypothetical protein [Nitrospirota bacterium]